MKTKYLAEAAVIAAIYALLTIVLAPISYGAVQVRMRLPCFLFLRLRLCQDCL